MAVFSVMWQEVRKSIGDRRDLDTEIKAALNDAVVDLTMMYYIRQTIASVTFDTLASTYTYLLGSSVLDVISVRNDESRVPLEYSDYATFSATSFDDTDNEGTPTLWFTEGESLYVFNNTPDAAYTLTYRYLRQYSDMSNDLDSFPLPREWERPAKLLAKSYIFELLGQNEKAIAAYQQMSAVVAQRKGWKAFADIYRGDNRINMGDYPGNYEEF